MGNVSFFPRSSSKFEPKARLNSTKQQFLSQINNNEATIVAIYRIMLDLFFTSAGAMWTLLATYGTREYS